MFYIMFGHDRFSLQQELKNIKAGLGNPEMLAINTNLLDGHELSLGELQDNCSAVPFLHQFRLVIVEGLLERFDPSKKQEKRAHKTRVKSDSGLKEWQTIGSYIEKMPATTVLILIDGKLDNRKNPLLTHLSSLAKVKFFPQPQGKILLDWIKKRISEGGGDASPKAISLLDELIGGDLWSMSNEIDKLLAFSQGRLITEDDVRQITSYTREDNIFALVDAILEGRRKIAQHLFHRLIQEGVVPPQILVMVTQQFRRIIIAKELSQKLPRLQVMSKMGITSDYFFDKVLGQARTYTVENVKMAYHKVLEADMAIKTGKYDGELAMDLLIIELGKR